MNLFQFSFGWPQLIWILLAMVTLLENGVKHGQPKCGKHSVNQTGFGIVISIALLWWGGFFGA